VIFTVNGKRSFTNPCDRKKCQEQWPLGQSIYIILPMQIEGSMAVSEQSEGLASCPLLR
jgi:hypothetical protein